MKQRIILDKLSEPKLVDYVIKELNSIQELPKSGLLAGQAVASIIFQYLKLDLNPVVNDIDIFYIFNQYYTPGVAGHSRMSKEVERFLHKRQATKDLSLVGMNELFLYNDYGQINISTGKKYSILGTTNFKKINRVFVSNLSMNISYSRSSFVYDIIDSFDINCTQVGIDLYNKRLYFTEAFILFLYTKQMEIAKYNTPIHSLFRLIRKNKEIGSYINLEEEKMLVSNMVDSYQSYLDLTVSYKRIYNKEKVFLDNLYHFNSDINKREANKKLNDLYDQNIFLYEYISNSAQYIDKAALGFGSKHLKQYESIQEFIPEFEVKKLAHVFSQREENEVLWHKELTTDTLNTLTVKNDFAEHSKRNFMNDLKSFNPYKENLAYTKSYFETVEKMLYSFKESQQDFYKKRNNDATFSTIYSYPIMYKNMKKTKASTIHIINNVLPESKAVNLEDTKDFKSVEYIMTSILLKGFNNLDKFSNINMRAIKSFIKKAKQHSELNKFFDNFQSIKEVEIVNNTLDKLEEEFGVLVYGFLNRKNLQPKYFDYDTLRIQLRFQQIVENEDLKERKIDIDTEEYSIKELIKGIELKEEGSQMGHCVGGYAFSVKSGNSIIVAFNNKKIKKRMTLEIAPVNKDNLFRIVQLQAKYNTRCLLEDSIDMLKEVNKVYPIQGIEDNFKSVSYLFGLSDNNDHNREIVNNNPARQNIPEIDFDENDIPF